MLFWFEVSSHRVFMSSSVRFCKFILSVFKAYPALAHLTISPFHIHKYLNIPQISQHNVRTRLGHHHHRRHRRTQDRHVFGHWRCLHLVDAGRRRGARGFVPRMGLVDFIGTYGVGCPCLFAHHIIVLSRLSSARSCCQLSSTSFRLLLDRSSLLPLLFWYVSAFTLATDTS